MNDTPDSMDSSKSEMPIRAYVANTWSGLERTSRTSMQETIGRLESVIREFGMSTFVSLRENPPGPREPAAAEKLWNLLRTEMGKCHVFVLINAGPSQGGTKELINARDHLVPVVVLTSEGAHLHELCRSPALQLLGEIPYCTPSAAEDGLRSFLREHREQVRRHARHLDIFRASFKNAASSLPDTIDFLRKERGYSRQRLAEEALISRHELDAIETDVVSFNPPFNHLASLALALGTDLSHLFWSPKRWHLHEFELQVVAVSEDLGWPVPLVDCFRMNCWQQAARGPDQFTEEDTRKEMLTWRRLMEAQRTCMCVQSGCKNAGKCWTGVS
ncbi:MAG: helix-turn-helix transcriptional regulator [Chloroflexi bacterium]|nr:helix-turn-helix transcriptional regulator [Chloroflexota bacterium]